MKKAEKKREHWRGDNKDDCRKIGCMNWKNSPSRRAMFVPGKTAKDIKLAFDKHTIDVDTTLILTEGNTEGSIPMQMKTRVEYLKEQKKVIEERGIKKVFYHPDSLHTVPLNYYLNGGEQVDYGYFDVCNIIDKKMVAWMKFCRDRQYFAKDMMMVNTTLLKEIKTSNEYYRRYCASRQVPSNNYMAKYIDENINFKNSDMDVKRMQFCNRLFNEASHNHKHVIFYDYVYDVWADVMQGRVDLHELLEYRDDIEKAGGGRHAGWEMLFTKVQCDFIPDSSAKHDGVIDEIESTINSEMYIQMLKELGVPHPSQLKLKETKKEEVTMKTEKSPVMIAAGLVASGKRHARKAKKNKRALIMYCAVKKANDVMRKAGLPIRKYKKLS